MDMTSYWLCFQCMLLLNMSHSSIALVSPSSVNEADRSALLRIKYQIHDPLGTLSSWNDSLNHCDWKGITCGGRHRDRVTILDLESQKLEGTLAPYIGNLTFLRQLILDQNNFGGEIPKEIGQLFRLELLSLQNNSFIGSIPTNLTHCFNLKILDLNGNKLSGNIFPQLSPLWKLEQLFLSINDFTGYISPALGNLSYLTHLSMAYNHLEGNIPEDLCHIQRLGFMQVGGNNLTGEVPSCIYNNSNLDFFGVALNNLEGRIPTNIGLTLPFLREIHLSSNTFTGHIPDSLSNATRLETISFEYNSFSGSVPNDLGGLQNLSYLWFNLNQLGTNGGDDLKFITSLTNCSNLVSVDISGNSFKGPFPNSISNISTTLISMYAGDNQIYGSIPVGIGNLVNLQVIEFNTNQLIGNIPSSIGELSKLVKISLRGNMLSGEVPASLGNLSQLTYLQLDRNNFYGRIPPALGNCQNLLLLFLSHNNFIGTIPKEVIGLSSLTIGLNLQNNFLTGYLPSEVGNCTKMVTLAVSENKLSHHIPATLGNCLSLEGLYMDGNFFQGEIPKSVSSLRGLLYLDLSRNNLSGEIPKYLERLPLQYLNLSFNHLEGPVPADGVFGNASSISVDGNKNLCGGIAELQLHSCTQKSKRKSFSVKLFVPVILGSISLLVISCCFLVYYRRKGSKRNLSSTELVRQAYKRVSYAELLRATNGFSSDNLIGVGSYGSVFKGILQEIHLNVAVKVLNLQREGASKSFFTECNALRNIRHRNLLKVITSCSGVDFQGNDFKAIIFEFMPEGSLEDWLHPRDDGTQLASRNLNFIQRLNIALDVAYALEYLHHQCEPGIVHCDLKPSNVLLDEDKTAHVADFGIAKMFSTNSDSAQGLASSLGIKGSVGYVAPEYGLGGEVSRQGDIYSYGILLLEMFTKKKPTNDMFLDGLTLRKHAEMELPNQVMDIVDPTILSEETDEIFKAVGDRNSYERFQECLVSLIKLGVTCSAESPMERTTLEKVITELHHIKDITKV